MDKYKGAMYQREVMDELSRQADVYFYGPGFSGYNPDDTIVEVLNNADVKPDLILMGHSWLMDKDGIPVDPHPRLGLEKTDFPKVAILNKEYVCLREKLSFIKSKGFDLVFTHHHAIEDFIKMTGIEFVFWPFAFDQKKFGSNQESERPIDFAFSGILRNQNRHARQSDIRLRIQNKIFECVGDIPVFKRRKFKKYHIFWNAIPRKRINKCCATILKKYRYLTEIEYSKLQGQTKIFLNTLSPMGLISPRYYENMASRALVFCEESHLYNELFPDHCYVTFKSDLSDFEEKLFHFLDNPDELLKVTQHAYKEAMEKHTWQKRVESLIQVLNGRCETQNCTWS